MNFLTCSAINSQEDVGLMLLEKKIKNTLHISPVISLIHYIGNRVMVLSIRFFDGFVFWVGK